MQHLGVVVHRRDGQFCPTQTGLDLVQEEVKHAVNEQVVGCESFQHIAVERQAGTPVPQGAVNVKLAQSGAGELP